MTLHIAPGRADGTIGFSVIDTGVGIPDDKLSLDLRGLPAGRRHDVAQVRRHRPGPVDLARDRPPARRRAARAVRRRARARRFTLVLPLGAPRRRPTPARSRPSPPPAGRRRPRSSRPPRCCPSTASTTIAPRSSPATACCSIIAHDAELAPRRAGRGARARASAASSPAAPPLGLALAREYRPEAVLIFSADGRGEVLLSQLKQHPETRHRPVFVAGPAGGRMSALRAGAAGLPGGRARDRGRHATWPRRSTRFNARAVRAPGAHRGRRPSSTRRR